MRKIKFEREGANGINSVTSYLIINEDSIYLYDRTTHLLSLANDRSIVKDKKRINIVRCLKGDSIFAPSELFPRTNSPILKIGDELLLSGTLFYEFEGENDSNRPVMAIHLCIILEIGGGVLHIVSLIIPCLLIMNWLLVLLPIII